MTNISQLLNTLNTSPSVELLRIRNREMTIEFFVHIYPNKQGAVSSENMHAQLADFWKDAKLNTMRTAKSICF